MTIYHTTYIPSNGIFRTLRLDRLFVVITPQQTRMNIYSHLLIVLHTPASPVTLSSPVFPLSDITKFMFTHLLLFLYILDYPAYLPPPNLQYQILVSALARMLRQVQSLRPSGYQRFSLGGALISP